MNYKILLFIVLLISLIILIKKCFYNNKINLKKVLKVKNFNEAI